MEFRVLGPLEVSDGGRLLTPSAPKQRAILTILVLHASEVVSADRLLDLVWGDELPSSGAQALPFHISKLRNALDPGRKPGEEGVVVTRPPGYLLQVEPEQIDAVRFEGMVREAGALLSSDPGRAVDLIDEALRLWRGPPLVDFTYEEFAQPDIRRLEELRELAIEDRIDARLVLGRHRDLVAELQTMTERNPLRERPWGQLMVALYRSGRQAEALDAYLTLSGHLDRELGIEPSPELRALEERVLQQDPALLEPAAPPGQRLRGYELLGKLGEGAHGVVWRAVQPELGRDVAIKTIRSELANRPEFVRRFETEAHVVASLEHPHIVSLFDFWRDPDGAYLVMPYLRGGSLGEAMRHERLDRSTAWSVLEDVGAALAYAHRRGVVHRDVSPSNILLDEDGNAYLADLGVAALVGDPGESSSVTAYTSPEQIAGEPATPQSDVFSLGVLAWSLLTREEPAPSPWARAERHPELPAATESVIARATEARPADRFPAVDAFLTALRETCGGVGVGVRAVAPVDVAPGIRNPYKGLRAFDEADAADFFGRDQLVDELVDRVARSRLVGVVGPSGCGKTSLVRAGLVPALRAGALPRSDEWLIADFHPGPRPFPELEAALLRVAVERPPHLAERLRSEATELGELDELLSELLPTGSQLVLVVDQFEELFTLTADEAIRRRFMDVLIGFADIPHDRVRLVITLRADFYDRPLRYADFGRLLQAGLVSVTMPSSESLGAAATRPAEGAGLRLEAGLESEIVRDVSDQPGSLPLMEFALTELFHQRRDHVLEIESYRHGGGVRGALGRRADQLYGAYPVERREAVRQVFLRLVSVGEEAADTRRRVPLVELHDLTITRDDLDAVLDDFVGHRLLTFDRDPITRAPTVEVAHEALLTAWNRLADWIDDRRHDLLLHRRFAAARTEWEESGRQPGYLLTGGRLAQFGDFAQTTDLALTDGEHEYIAASHVAEDELRARRRRRRQGVLAAFGVAALVALVLAGVALRNERRAGDAAALARSRALSEAAIGVLDDDPELSLLLGLEAAEGETPAGESIVALHEAVLANRVLLAVEADGGALAPDGSRFLTFQRDVVEARNADDGRVEWTSEAVGDPWAVRGGFFSPDGSRFVVVPTWDADDDDARFKGRPVPASLLVLRMADGAWERPPIEYECPFRALIPDGYGRVHLDRPVLVRAVATTDGACDDEHVAVLAVDVEGGDVEELARFSRAEISLGGWTTDSDGRLLALGIAERTTVVDLATGESTPYGPPAQYGASNAISGDGRLVVTSNNLESTVWDVERDVKVVRFTAGPGTGDASFAADESLVVNRFGVSDVETGDLNVPFLGHRGRATISDDGTRAVTAAGGRVVLWDTGIRTEVGAVRLPTGGYQNRSLVVAAGRAAIVDTGSLVFGEVIVVDLATGEVERRIPDVSGPAVALSADGSRLAVQREPRDGWFGTVEIIDLDSGDIVSRMEGLCVWDNAEGPGRDCAGYPTPPFAAFVVSLQFTPDGSVLVAGMQDVREEKWPRTVAWDTATGDILYWSPRSRVAQPILAPGGEYMVLAGDDEPWMVDLGDWSDLGEVPVFGRFAHFTTDGSRLVTGPWDLRVYDAATWSERSVTTDDRFGDLAIAPDASVIATAGSDGFVRVYDLDTLELLQMIPIGDEVTSVEFVSDQHLLVVPRPGPGYTVTVDVDELLDIARDQLARSGRSFTPDECAWYEIDPCPAGITFVVDRDEEEAAAQPTPTPTTQGSAPDADSVGGSPGAVIEALTAAYNSGDIDQVMSYFGEGSVIVGHPFAGRLEGLEQIRETMLEEWDFAADTDPARISNIEVTGDTVTWDHQLTSDEGEEFCFTGNSATVEDGKIATRTFGTLVDCSLG